MAKKASRSSGTDRLKEELQNYVQARMERGVSNVDKRLGDAAARLAEGRVRNLPKAVGAAAPGDKLAVGKAAMTKGAADLKDKIKEKAGSLPFTGPAKKGEAKAKSVTVVEDIDIGRPVREVYDQWTRYQEFSDFTKGVVDVEQVDDTTSDWRVKIVRASRSWRANVVEQIPDERIAWTSEGAKGTTKGVVTFHPLGDNLTKVLVVLEYFPEGLVEKLGNIWRAQGRRLRLDLKLFRKFVMMREEAPEGWRGEIRDGEVVRDQEEGEEKRGEEEEEEQDEEEYEYDNEPSEEEEEEAEEEEPEEEEPEEEEAEAADDEAERKPSRRRTAPARR